MNKRALLCVLFAAEIRDHRQRRIKWRLRFRKQRNGVWYKGEAAGKSSDEPWRRISQNLDSMQCDGTEYVIREKATVVFASTRL